MSGLFRNLALGTTLLLSACATQIATTAVEESAEQSVQQSERFEINNDPWMALHHYAYHQARALSGQKLRGRVPMLEADIAAFTPDVATAFESVREAYKPYLAASILFNGRLRSIAISLVHDGIEDVQDKALKQALKDFMPVYQEHFWNRHQAGSAEFIIALNDQLKTYGEPMANRLATYLDGEWGAEPLRVDIVPYANWAGAYTGTRPTGHLTISSNDPEIKQHMFEMLFHEASHTSPLGDQLDVAADVAIAQTGFEFPRYWHALLWYASGTAARETLGPDYDPYYVTSGRLTDERSSAIYRAFETVWDQHDTIEARAIAAAEMALDREK